MKAIIKKIIGLLIAFVPIGYGYASIAVEIAEKINGETLKIAVATAVCIALVAMFAVGCTLLTGDD